LSGKIAIRLFENRLDQAVFFWPFRQQNGLPSQVMKGFFEHQQTR